MIRKPIRIGIIGCGYWGPNVLRNFIEIPDSEVVAVADLKMEQLNRVKDRYPQISYLTQNYQDLFRFNLDAVVITTPPQTHYSLAKACLMHGLHVLTEKPLTLDSKTAADLDRIATNKNLTLMVGHTFEFNAAVHELRRMIQSGELGKIQYIDMVRASLGLFQTHCNVLWDLAPHDISILRHILGADPESVSAQGSSFVQENIEDVVYLNFNFPDKVMAHCRVSWLDPLKTRRVTVVGDKKMVIYDDVEPLEKIKVYNKSVEAQRRTDTFGEFTFAYHHGDSISPFIHFEEPLRMQCLHFLDCIFEAKMPLTNAENGLRVIEALEAAQISLDNQGALTAVGKQAQEHDLMPAQTALSDTPFTNIETK